MLIIPAAWAFLLSFSPVKMVIKKMDSVKSYSQNNKLYWFLSDFLCKIGQNSNWLAARPVMKKIHFYLISCLIINLVTHIQIAKFCSEKVEILDHPSVALLSLGCLCIKNWIETSCGWYVQISKGTTLWEITAHLSNIKLSKKCIL